MNKRGAVILRVLMNRFNPKATERRLKDLPDALRQLIVSEAIDSKDLTPILQHPALTFSEIHYSWFSEPLKKFPKDLLPTALGSLGAMGANIFSGVKPDPHVSLPTKQFLHNTLVRALKLDEHVPMDYLPECDFSPLLKWSKEELMNLVDFLGLHDLAYEVRHIVNRNHLKNIYTCLTPKQFYYLKQCLHQKDRIVSPKLMVDPAIVDKDKLKQALHKRGLFRLSKALCGIHPDFVWHLAHHLDTGRGNLLLKDYQLEAVPKMTSILKQQTINLMNFLKSEQ